MSRYLTPSKTCLLALIEVYLEGHVPSSASVSVLSFLILNILPSKTSVPSPLTLQAFEKNLSAYASSIPGRSIWDILLLKIWSFEYADHLHIFFDELDRLLKKPKLPPNEEDEDEEEDEERHKGVKLTKTSPLGIFVRRAQVEFTRLNFEDTVRLWKAFVVYREPSYDLWAKRSGASGPSSMVDTNLLAMADMRIQDITYGDLPDPKSPEAQYSAEDVDQLIDYYVADISKTGNRLPEEIRNKLSEFASSSNITVSSASHYVRYLDAWKAGDYPSALDCLHRYFDYTIQTRDKSHYQYALLNLALLHAHFGAHDEAVAAMQETVATARENKDTGCLNYSLSWLYHYGVAHPQSTREIQQSGVLGRGKEALAFLQAKSREAGSWDLLSSSLIADARLTMLQGDSLSSAVENLVGASHLNLTKRLPRAVGAAMATEATLWSRLGAEPLADIRDEVFLQCYSAGADHADAVNATCRRADALAQRGRYEEALAIMHAVPSQSLRTLTAHDTWSTALGMMKLQRAIRQQDFNGAESYLSQLRAIAGMTSDGVGDSGRGGSIDAALNITHLEMLLLIARGELATAFEKLDATSQALEDAKADIFHRVRLMLLKARLWATAGHAPRGFSVVMRAASIALSSRLITLLCEAVILLSGILVALSEFEAAQKILESIIPHVLSTRDCDLSARAYEGLAESHVGLAGKAGKHRDVASSPDAKARRTPSPKNTRSGVGNTAARSTKSPQHMHKESAAASATPVGSLNLERKREIAKALGLLDNAFDQWSAIEDVRGQTRTLAKRSMLMHLSGDSQLANDTAAKYRDIVDKAREGIQA